MLTPNIPGMQIFSPNAVHTCGVQGWSAWIPLQPQDNHNFMVSP